MAVHLIAGDGDRNRCSAGRVAAKEREQSEYVERQVLCSARAVTLLFPQVHGRGKIYR